MEKQELVGLGGWLMLFIVSLIYQIVTALPEIAILGRLDYHNMLDLGHAVVFVLSLAGTVIALILIILRSRMCPKFVVSFLIFVIVSNITAVAILKSGTNDNFAAKAGLAISTIKSMAWMLYFLSSRRVRNTFYGVPLVSQEAQEPMVGGGAQ